MTAVRVALLRWSRYLVTPILLGSGVLLSANVGPGNRGTAIETPYSAIDPPEFEVSLAAGRARIHGHSASREHEKALRAAARRLFAQVDVEFRPLVAARGSWPGETLGLLEAIASSTSAVARLTNDVAEIRAVVSDSERWHERFGAFRAGLNARVRVNADVLDVSRPFPGSCEKAYDQIRSQPVVFDRASAELRTAMHSLLDRHVDFALDCDAFELVITGHTDSRGDEKRNQALSLERARAVAAYLVSRGVPSERVSAAGAGSSEPIASNETDWGRVRNRRIEFSLREFADASL